MINIGQALQRATEALVELPNASLEAHYLLATILNKSRAYLIAFEEKDLTENQTTQFTRALQRRQQGEPLAYICGQKEFWSLTLSVTPAVLIPRPETELLVETVLSLYSSNTHYKVADLGTGSGAIALALASERSTWEITASDISEAALSVAKHNASQLGIANVSFEQGDWCAALGDAQFDVIVSNPPYIDAVDTDLEKAVLQYEPSDALIAAENGLAAIKIITKQAVAHLVDGGYLCFEHGYLQADAVATVLADNGFQAMTTLCDLQGLPRVSYAIKRD